MLALVVHIAAVQINIAPNANAPGVDGLKTMVNDGAMYAAVLCGLAFIGGVLAIAAGHGFQLRHATEGGKLAVVWSLVAALMVASATAIVNAALSL